MVQGLYWPSSIHVDNLQASVSSNMLLLCNAKGMHTLSHSTMPLVSYCKLGHSIMNGVLAGWYRDCIG